MTASSEKIIYKELSYKVNGVLFKARNDVGLYGNEKQYCDAIEKRLAEEKIGFEREKILEVSFDGEHKGRNKVDFLIDNNIVLEVKAKQFITKEDYYQIRRYLMVLNKKLGILVNMIRYSIYPKRALNSGAES